MLKAGSSDTPVSAGSDGSAVQARSKPAIPGERRTAGQIARSVVPAAILLILFLTLWEVLVRREVISPIIVAPPSRTASGLVDLVQSPGFRGHFLTTALEALVGGMLGMIGGLVLGIASSVSPFLNRTLYPYVVFFQGLPKVVLAPVFVTWFGFGVSSKIAMVIVLTFFPLYINTLLGLSTTDASAMSLMRSYGASKRDILLKLQLPSALPSIFAGVKTSASFALIGSIVAEIGRAHV